jgi:ubiquinone/menaquinone biosynthesis C-methylase UbiE
MFSLASVENQSTSNSEERGMKEISDHYTQGTLEAAFLDALTAAGKDPERLTIEDLAPMDEFHVGGREATRELASQMDLRPGLRVLDVGSGLGGPARFLAQQYDCRLIGIDLTEEYVRVAESLSDRVGLSGQVHFCRADATQLPFASASFDRAYMIHVGMNIENKAALFAEVRRVLRPGGAFAIYDIVRDGPGAIRFPVPWASTPAISFVAPIGAYREALEVARFSIARERNRRGFAIEFFERAGPPGLRPVMGRTAADKVANVADAIRSGIVFPVEIVAH